MFLPPQPISALDLAKKSDGAKGQQSSESVEPPQLEVRVNLVRWRPDSGSPPPTTHEIADQEKEPQSETSQEKIPTQELRPTLLSYHSQVAYENLEKDVQCQLLVKRLAKVREGVPPGMVIDTRASENFRGCLPQSPLKNLGQMLAPLAILGHLERFSPGQNGSEVGCPARLFRVI